MANPTATWTAPANPLPGGTIFVPASRLGICVVFGFGLCACNGVLFLDPGYDLIRGCTTDADCDHGVCRRGDCVTAGDDLPDGSDCEAPTQCHGGFCNRGTCAAAPPTVEEQLGTGERCTQDEDCRSGICESFGEVVICTALCVATCAGENLACFDGQCVPDDYCENENGEGDGPGCEENRDTCASCDVNATCIEADGSFTCVCRESYYGNGLSCERDDCYYEPCQNGGTCTDVGDDYRCLCPYGFEGDNCEIKLNDCTEPNPCQNGGYCLDGDHSYTCACQEGWEGDHCEADIDECADSPCQNGGACFNDDGGYHCVCAPGYTGQACEYDLNDCPLPDPCQNGGDCVDGLQSYSCACAEGFDGIHCENNVDDCAADPCQNGGTCNDGIAGYSCDCPPGYAGSDCEEWASCTQDLDCAGDQYCDVGGLDECRPRVCAPNAKRCEGGAEVWRCTGNGSGEVLLYACTGRAELTSTCVEPAPGDAYCTCQDDWDCPEFTACEAYACTGTGQPPTCTLEPLPFSTVPPVIEIEWGGTEADPNAVDSPFPASAQVVQSPIVANLDDDNGDGLIDERDFPEIIFATFCDSDFTTNGILRAIHGGGPNKGADYFASCGVPSGAGDLWQEGMAMTGLTCTCTQADLDPTTSLGVGDLDYDGVPEILAVTEGNYLRVYSNTGEIITVTASAYTWNGGQNPGINIANLDNEGFAEIIIGSRVFTLELDGNGDLRFLDTFFGNSYGGRQGQGPVSCVADLIGDDRLEIVGGSVVYSFPRPPACATQLADCDGGVTCPPAGATVEEQAFCAGSLIIEWDRGVDGFCAIADVLGSDQDSPPGLDNPLDGTPEIVLISNDGQLRIYNGQDGVLKLTYDPGLGIRGGAPNVDDFDGDGFPEIGTAFAFAYALMDLQATTADCPAWPVAPPNQSTSCESVNSPRSPPGVVCTQDADCNAATTGFACNEQIGQCLCEHNSWRRQTEDDSSRVTGSSVFDFNGDGAAEVIYNDECYFRIYDGLSGDVHIEEPSESRTRIEYPIVADVDNDGNAEIVFAASNESHFCSDQAPEYNNGLEVWGDALDVWVSARRIWNQHAYHVTNINEAGRPLVHEPKGWLPHNGRLYNTYRSNPRSLGIAPDLIITSIQIAAPGGGCLTSGTQAIIAVRIKNQGDLRVGPGVQLALFGDWGSGEVTLLTDIGTPLVATVGNTLEPEDVIFLTLDYDADDNGEANMPNAIRVEIDSTARERECDEDNNESILDLTSGANQGAELRAELGSVDDACDRYPVVGTTIFNDGNQPVSNVVVRYFAGDPEQGGTLLQDAVLNATVAPGGSGTMTVELSPAFPYCLWVQIFAVVDPENTVDECNDGNNKATQSGPTFCCGG